MMIEKELIKCRICKIEKNLSEFNKDSRKKNGYSTFCKTCKKEIDNISYMKRKDKISLRKLNNISEIREEYLNIKNDLSCIKCGENKHYMIDFHHINNENKEFTIGTKLWQSLNIEIVKLEIDKCVVLCSNHHREFHYLNKTEGIILEDYINNKHL
jgi:hypothetical protein